MFPHAPTPAPAAAHDSPVFPFDLRWDAQALADAVPLRLFELVRVDADVLAAANHPPRPLPARRRWRDGYAPRDAAARLFRVG